MHKFRDQYFRRALVQPHVPTALLVQMHDEQLVGQGQFCPTSCVAGLRAKYVAIEEWFSKHQGFNLGNIA